MVTSPRTLNRIHRLSIPPAYEEVWISPYENGHLQATARDALGRKQYFYHPEWIQIQTSNKFHRVYVFGKHLPLIRKKIRQDLKRPGLHKERVLAALVSIMDKTHVRIGNDIYAKTHQTFGLTTLRKRHASISRKGVCLKFEGKNQTPWEIRLEDPKVVKVIKKCTDIPGYELFKYIDEEGQKRVLCSEDFNAYLQTLSGQDFTAKDFRTWAACKETFCSLASRVKEADPQNSPQLLKDALKKVARLMGHTLAVCTQSYIHPALIQSWENGAFQRWIEIESVPPSEKLFLKWWKAHIKEAKVTSF